MEYTKAENVQDFFKRSYNFLDEIKISYSDKNVLIVCHAGITKAIECYVNGMMKDEDIGPYLPNNASIQEYDIR